MKRGLLAALVLTLASHPLLAESPRPDPSAEPVAGEEELPKVLYIVPWKEIDAAATMPPPPAGRDESSLLPLDRDSVRRQLRYRDGGKNRQAGDGPAR